MTEYIYIPVPQNRLLDVYGFLGTPPAVDPSTIEIATISDAPVVSAKPVRHRSHTRVSNEIVEQAKPHVKRMDGTFTVKELADAMGVHQTAANDAMHVLEDQGWVQNTQPHRGRRPALFQYLPAREAPATKREDGPHITGRGKIENGTGPIAGTGKKDAPRGEIGHLIGLLRKQGWQVERSDGGHYKARLGSHTVIMPSTPSDTRGIANLRAELRRAGAKV